MDRWENRRQLLRMHSGHGLRVKQLQGEDGRKGGADGVDEAVAHEDRRQKRIELIGQRQRQRRAPVAVLRKSFQFDPIRADVGALGRREKCAEAEQQKAAQKTQRTAWVHKKKNHTPSFEEDILRSFSQSIIVYYTHFCAVCQSFSERMGQSGGSKRKNAPPGGRIRAKVGDTA